MRPGLVGQVLLWTTLCCWGCGVDNPELAPLELDRALFECDVEPVLVARCAFGACHGTPERPFQLFGPNRLRLGVPESERAIAQTRQEHDRNFAAARAFARGGPGYPEPLLVSKPLAEDLGGAYHVGASLYAGGDVFIDDDDPDLAVLRDWVDGASLDGECTP